MRGAAVIGVVLLAAALPGAAPAASTSGCSGLTGVFSVVRGSAGAGQITYRLQLRNAGSATCTLRGTPRLRLYGAGGKPLRTKVQRDRRFRVEEVVVKPRGRATAQARFTPDVHGKGEQVPGPCEPVARTLRLTVPGAVVVVPIRPPTRVCDSGRLVFSPYR